MSNSLILQHNFVIGLRITKGGQLIHDPDQPHGEVLNALVVAKHKHLVLTPHLLCARLANTIIANLHHFDASQASSVVSFVASTVIISGGTALHMASSAI
jgi:hypothetical protein